MKIKTSLFLCLLAIAAVVLLGAPLVAIAAHPPVAVLDAGGTAITNGTTPYSPKQTCGGCHFDCTNGSLTEDTTKYCQTDVARRAWYGVVTLGTGTSCNTLGKCPDYESSARKTINQSVHTGGGNFVDQTTTFPAHGASTGSHVSQGKNETLTNDQRQIWGQPAFISSAGMIGRF
jgi:hypothetical protein